MDGWHLDELDDDHHLHRSRSISPPTTVTTTTTTTTITTPSSRLYEQNDRNITKNNNDNTPFNEINNNNNNNKFKSAHGYVHMSKDKDSNSSIHPRSRDDNQELKNGNSSKFPWRDTKHETLFDLVDEHTQKGQLRDHGSTPRPQQFSRNNNRQQPQQQSYSQQRHANDSDADTSSSLSLGDIIDAVNQGDESMDPSRSSKIKHAKQRLAELSNDPNNDNGEFDHEDFSNLVGGGAGTDSTSSLANSASSRTFQNNQEAFRQQRFRVLNAATMIDLNDNRSLAPLASSNEKRNAATRTPTGVNGQSKAQTTVAPTTTTTTSAAATTVTNTGSRDTEIGDRGSTTSRDSVYRDSLSGSTLGSAGFQAQLEGIKKHEMATVLTVLNSAAVAQLFPESEKTSTRMILPHNVNANTKSPMPNSKQEQQQQQQQVSTADVILSEDTDATPRPKTRTFSTSSIQSRRINPENDLARAKQYATLANRGHSKQNASAVAATDFVEELANATAMKSAIDISFKSSHSPESTKKSSERQVLGAISEKLDSVMEQEQQQRMDDDDEENVDEREAEIEDLGLLAGSQAMENAFKSLQDLDASIDLTNLRDEYTSKRAQTDDDEGVDNYLSAVLLPSKPKRRGEYSLKWENQIETTSIADTSRHGMMAEQASFSHAEGQLIHFITALHPYDEWDQVKSLDLTKREIESTIRLDHLVSNLEVLILNENQVPYLTGIPKSVKTLQVRSNLLDDLTNFSHLSNLQYLDISHNSIQDLTGLSCLVHLRELIAEGNKIKSVSALQQMDGLIRLDVSRNCLTSLDFRWSKLQRLEYLNASHNKIEQLENLESLAGLIHANLARNCIEDISLVQPLRRLRILRLSENKLVTFDATPFPGLRTLYLDDNRLQTLENCQKLTRLENFSARDQEGEGIAIDMLEFINSRKLYLSGNPIQALYFEMGFYRLEYLEICAGCLSELPIDFATLFPNLRGLNLSYNGLDSISALDGLNRLRRLIFVGNNLKSFSDVLSLVKRMRSLVTLDLRHNPLTSNMYPAMSIRQGSKYQDTYRTNQNSETELDWRRRDVGFRRALPDAMYVKRSVYRSAILKSCKRLEWFDGGSIQAKERERAPIVLSGMLDNYGWNYLANNRREDEEEEYDYDGENGEYYYDGAVDEQQEAEWLYNQARLDQMNQDVEVDGDEEYHDDGRDPEDITDDSKRQGSSVDSGSVTGHHRQYQHPFAPKSPSRLSGVSQRRLRSSTGYQISSSSPSPRVSAVMSNNRLSGSISRSKSSSSKRPTSSSEYRIIDQQQQDDEDIVGDAAHYEGSSDKRSAVRTWRDEVNEVSHRRSPRVRASVGSSAILSSASGSQEIRSRSQQIRRGGDKGSISGSDSGSSHGSQGGSLRAGRGGNGPQEISTIAVAYNSSGEIRRQSQERRPGVRRLSIPVLPSPHIHQSPAISAHRPSSMHTRRRSDGNAMAMMTPTSGRRPRSQHGMAGFENGEAIHHHQLSMSPMGGPSTMTASGTVLRPNHHRRRSTGLYPTSRKMDILARESNTQSPSGNHGPMSMSMSAHMLTQSPVASPGYFGTTHHNMQSPFGFGKGSTPAPAFGAAVGVANNVGGRSLPNTPSRAGGRVSRVSLGQGAHHYPQTLARDMELSEMEN
ncbi:hypothetical protein BGZ49_001962 [Haplosporangium sp. Z 27]|nr:hypothetical protein BGZ49_001962 [Haplosporangium sp. Z 27]